MSTILNQKQIGNLDKIGSDFGCELLFPPAKEITNPFFDISKIRHDVVAFGDFLVEIKKIGNVTYDSVQDGSRIFLEVRDV